MINGVIMTTAYLPPAGWFDQILQHSMLTIDAAENYQKGSWRNRCLIAGPNGPQRLSIPLEKGKHQQTPIREVRISYRENWPLNHWRSIQTAYGSAPFFPYYKDELQAIYASRPEFLFDFNLVMLNFLLRKCKWKGEVKESNDFLGNPTLPDGTNMPYQQVFQDRYGFVNGLSMLDRVMCGQAR